MRRVRLFLMDVDGVLTDGRIIYATVGGETVEVKLFDAKDGLTIVQAGRLGLPCGVISNRSSPAVRQRCQEQGMAEIILGCEDKLAGMEQAAANRGLALDQVGYMGDDLYDLAALRRAGLAIAPADAVPEVKAVAHYVTSAPGGRGAVREALTAILRAQGLWDNVLAAFGGGETT